MNSYHLAIIHTVPKPNITFSGSLSFTSLYSATVFSLTCVVKLVPEVDAKISIITTWNKDRSATDSSDRIKPDSMASQNNSISYVYESILVFNPLSNMKTGGDDGNYTCSVEVKGGDFFTGISTNATQAIEVKG